MDNRQYGKGIFYWGSSGNKYEGDFVDDKRYITATDRFVIFVTGCDADTAKASSYGHLALATTVIGSTTNNTARVFTRYDRSHTTSHRFYQCTDPAFQWPNGNRYEGDWNFEMRQGYGVHYWFNGAVYEGEYSKNVKHGKGTFKEAGGWTITCEWINDIPGGAPECLNPLVVDALDRKVCTFTVTGEKTYGQLYYRSSEADATKKDGYLHVCLTCRDICLSQNGFSVCPEDPALLFGAALFCECGTGPTGKPCHARPQHDQKHQATQTTAPAPNST